MCASHDASVGGMDAGAFRKKLLSVFSESKKRLSCSPVPQDRLSLLQCLYEVAAHTSGIVLKEAEAAYCMEQSELFVVTVMLRGGDGLRPQSRLLRLRALWLLTFVLYPRPQENERMYTAFREELSRWITEAESADHRLGLSDAECLWRVGLLNRNRYMFLDHGYDESLARLADHCLRFASLADKDSCLVVEELELKYLAYMVLCEFYEMGRVRDAALVLGVHMGQRAARYPDGSYENLLCSACGVEAGCELWEKRFQKSWADELIGQG